MSKGKRVLSLLLCLTMLLPVLSIPVTGSDEIGTVEGTDVIAWFYPTAGADLQSYYGRRYNHVWYADSYLLADSTADGYQSDLTLFVMENKMYHKNGTA